MPMKQGDLERLIKAAIPDAEVIINDLRGDGDHYAAFVKSAQFIGKNRLQQHKMVYNALEGELGTNFMRWLCKRIFHQKRNHNHDLRRTDPYTLWFWIFWVFLNIIRK